MKSARWCSYPELFKKWIIFQTRYHSFLVIELENFVVNLLLLALCNLRCGGNLFGFGKCRTKNWPIPSTSKEQLIFKVHFHWSNWITMESWVLTSVHILMFRPYCFEASTHSQVPHFHNAILARWEKQCAIWGQSDLLDKFCMFAL